jgi:hypothetical protein
VLNVIGLNPSTAYDLGGTVRRCIELAKHHGFDALHVTNLFARRSINPRQLALAADPVGTENDQAILAAANSAAAVVCAWGTAGSLHGRDEAVEELLHAFTLRCFGFTKDGHPRHPLYLPTNTPLMAYPDVKLCRIHDLREPCPDCMTPTPQMIAEGYAIHRNPTAAQRAAYASRLPGDDSPRPWWRFHEHWELVVPPGGFHMKNMPGYDRAMTREEMAKAGLMPHSSDPIPALEPPPEVEPS